MNPEQRLMSVGILLAAISAASNALWYHYREAALVKRATPPDAQEKAEALQTSRWAGILFSLIQVTLFISNPIFRQEALGIGILALATAIFIQGLFQTRYETLLRGKPTADTIAALHRPRLLQPALFLVANAVAFILITQSSIVAAFVAARAVGISGWSWLGVLSISLAGGVGLALWTLHRSFPIQLTWMLKARHCDRDQLRNVLESLRPEARALLQGTEILSSEFERVFASPGAIAWMRKRGKRPSHRIIFIDQRMLRDWTRDEIAAVLAHEAAHLQDAHAGARFRTLLASSVLTFLVAGLVVAALASVGGWIAQFSTLFAACAVVAVPSLRLRSLVEKQEIAADQDAVDRFGAEPAALLSALDKIEALQPTWQTADNRIKRLPGASANRLTALRMLRLRERIQQAETRASETSERRSA